MFFITIGFIIGIIWGLYYKGIALFLSFFLIAIIFSIIIFNFSIKIKEKIYEKIQEKESKKQKVFIKYIALFFLFILIGFFYVQFINNTKDNIKDKLYSFENLDSVQVYGTITSSIKEGEFKNSFEISVEKIVVKEKRQVKISSFLGKKAILKVMMKKEKVNFFPGDYIRIYGKYDKTSSFNNFKVFNYEEYLENKDIYGVIDAKNIEVINIKKDIVNTARFKIIEYIKNKISRAFKENSRNINWYFNRR